MLFLGSNHRKLLFLFIVIILGLISAWIFIKYRPIQKEPLPVPISTSTPHSPAVPVPTSTVSKGTTPETKIYRNEEWGFEFQYPKDLIIRENTFGSYYSRFNLKIFTKIGEQFDPAFLVNIVLPEFVENSFKNLKKTTSEVIIDGIFGVKYQYDFNDRKETVIILPFNEYQLILGVYYEEYENVFNQILASFKFLR